VFLRRLRATVACWLTQGHGGTWRHARYCAAFDSQAARPDELNFMKGDSFSSVVEKDGDWWKMVLMDGQEGWVPASYVRLTSDADDKMPAEMPGGMPIPESPQLKQSPSTVKENGGMRAATHSTPDDPVDRARTPQQRAKTPKRTSEVGKALRESRNRRRTRAKSTGTHTPSAGQVSAFTEVTAI
jgi:hypothetical protein